MRKLNRDRVNVDAIIDPPRTALGECVVCDISDLGAKLYLDTDDTVVPERAVFFLHIPSRSMRYCCSLVWRSGREVGVEFVRWQ